MATKSITITDDAYNRLASFKEPNESFSDVVNKLTKKGSLLELAGILSNEDARELKENIRELRKRMEEEVDKRVEKMR